MIKKVTITRVFKSTENKDGVPYTYKTDSKYHKEGDPFVRIGIQVEGEDGTTHYANVDPKSKIMSLAEGETLLVNFTTSTGKDGTGEFKNFNLPTKDQLVEFANAL